MPGTSTGTADVLVNAAKPIAAATQMQDTGGPGEADKRKKRPGAGTAEVSNTRLSPGQVRSRWHRQENGGSAWLTPADGTGSPNVAEGRVFADLGRC